MLFPHRQEKKTPKVDLSLKKGELIFTGTSMPEDVHLYYASLVKSIEENGSEIKNNKLGFTVTMNLDYFNSASLKFFVALLKQILTLTGKDGLNVIWYYDKDDADMLETINEVSSVLSLQFQLVERTRVS